VDSLLKQFAASSEFIEDLYEQYLVNPDSLSPSWSTWFDAFKGREAGDVPHSAIADAVAEAGKRAARGLAIGPSDTLDERERHVGRLITAYRSRGHLGARLDPLGLLPSNSPPKPISTPSSAPAAWPGSHA